MGSSPVTMFMLHHISMVGHVVNLLGWMLWFCQRIFASKTRNEVVLDAACWTFVFCPFWTRHSATCAICHLAKFHPSLEGRQSWQILKVNRARRRRAAWLNCKRRTHIVQMQELYDILWFGFVSLRRRCVGRATCFGFRAKSMPSLFF